MTDRAYVRSESQWQTPRLYKVKSGDSLSMIAQRYAISVSKLKQQNNLRSSILRVGQKIKIPGVSTPLVMAQTDAALSTASVHTVKRGESLSIISAQYNITMKRLKAYNNIHKKFDLRGSENQNTGD